MQAKVRGARHSRDRSGQRLRDQTAPASEPGGDVASGKRVVAQIKKAEPR